MCPKDMNDELIPGEPYTFHIKDGERFINGVPAQEFISKLPRKELLKIVILGILGDCRK